MDQITDQIFLGDSADARAVLLKDNISTQVEAILCVAHDIFYSDYPNKEEIQSLIPIFKVGMYDGPGNTIKQFALAVSALDGISQQHKVLVHCHMGMSRSPTVVAAYLAIKNNCTLEHAFNIIASKRPLIYPNRAMMKLANDYLIERRGFA